MILEEKRSPVISTLTGERQEFRIATNSKAFRVLVDGIYADKIGSIVRELMSNAFDAHVRSGTTATPFEVRLPNALNPTFSVRDYGCSMAHEFVMASYSTLFESSKSESNDEVGAFGLGAKSFLAYTDACTLRCWLDGEERSYAIALSDSGVPEVRLVFRGHSDERTGVEVTFAVSHNDFSAFSRAATQCAYGFDVSPKFHGAEVATQSPTFQGAGWRYYSTRIMEQHSKVMVRQGCAVYPAWVSSGLPPEGCLVVDAPIGSVNVTASREALALTDGQRQALEQRVGLAVGDLRSKVALLYEELDSDIARARFADSNKTLLGAGDWLTGVKIDPPANRWDSGATTPLPFISVRGAATMIIVHDDGTPILRKRLRLRSLSRGRVLLIETESHRISEIVALLDLRPDQIKTISEIPDVTITRKAREPRTRQAKRPVQDIVWAFKRRNLAWAGDLQWKIGADEQPIFNSMRGGDWLYRMVRRHNGNEPLLLLTETEAKSALAKGQISESMRIDLLAKREVEACEADLRPGLLYSELCSATHNRSVREQIAKICGAAEAEFGLAPMFDLLSPARFYALKSEAHRQMLIVKGKYPLLFENNPDAVRTYIEMCDRGHVSDGSTP